MDENPMNKSIVAARSRRASRSIRIVLLVGVVAALASAAVLAGPQSHNLPRKMAVPGRSASRS